jgi:hypothetical protein
MSASCEAASRSPTQEFHNILWNRVHKGPPMQVALQDTTRTDVTSRNYIKLFLHATREALSTVFWEVTPYTVVADRRFGGTYCSNHEGHRKKPAKIKYSFLAWLT